jgi:hypothetical protein
MYHFAVVTSYDQMLASVPVPESFLVPAQASPARLQDLARST